MKRFREGKF
jgi:ATP-dependent RNA helicase DDX21